MQIVALDLATNTGIAVGRAGENPKCWSISLGDTPYVRGGMSQADKFKLESKRLNNALIMTQGLIQSHEPDLLVVEAAIGGKNASSFLIKLFGCVQGCAGNRRVNMIPVYPATVRRHFMGKAKTSRDFPHLKPAKAKLAIKEEIEARCRLLGWDVPDLDAADAAATWDWACATQVRGFQAKPTGGLF
ncbi:hypothetical protein [Ruegeria sp. EL01]|jgi:Holliday junction resolvasome RuvABC endonuclease subunit|uniref:hypothetical protein n=1 Tax=Ruegeria sp. EL01 TaxID=2107578 RepID=UPI000EA83739|nr:hypothetical protein [Ruegeria sp. EL01]